MKTRFKQDDDEKEKDKTGTAEDADTPIEEWFKARIRRKARAAKGDGEEFWRDIEKSFTMQDKIAMRAYLEEFGETPDDKAERSRREIIVQTYLWPLSPPFHTRTREVKALRQDAHFFPEHYKLRQPGNLSERPWRKQLSAVVEYIA